MTTTHERDHRFVSYHRSGEYGGHVVYYDAEGRRAPLEEANNGEDTPEFVVAVVGDSFVEALQVAYEDSFVGRLQAGAAARTQVLNYGTSAYGPLLYSLQWRTQIQHVAPTHVFLMLYSNDVRNDNAMAEMAVYDQDGRLIAVPGPSQTWHMRLGRQSHLGRYLNMVWLQLLWAWEHRNEERNTPVTDFVEENPNITPLTDAYLRQLVQEVRQSAADIVLLAVPSKERTLYRELRTSAPVFHDKVLEWADEHGVPFLDLAPAFYEAADAGVHLFFTRDIHFTVAGHKLVADTIRKACPMLFSSQPDRTECIPSSEHP